MNDEMFHGEAKLEDGRTLTADGTLMQCANWADNVVRAEGACEIEIRRAQDNSETQVRS